MTIGRTIKRSIKKIRRAVSFSPCKHKPDWSSVRPADTGGDGIIDVWCSKCGTSGSIQLFAGDIQW